MTAVRRSFLYAPEVTDQFASGATVDNKWYYPPAGAYISFSYGRSASSIYASGKKTRQTNAYGQISGQWTISYVSDFDHLEPLAMFFDYDKTTDSTQIGQTGFYEHVFKKKNDERVGHYAIKAFQKNKITAMGGEDEIILLKGCVPKSIQISRSIQGSQMSVEVSGVFADIDTILGDIDSWPYDDSFQPDLTQYSCMFISADGQMEDEDYIGALDSHSLASDNGVSLDYSTCSPIAVTYHEGHTSFQWNASTYSNDPTRFQLLVNSGGSVGEMTGVS